ncbi:MAG: alpha-hydroxy acid oxidase [Candidatus Hydrogenedentota bacterium]
MAGVDRAFNIDEMCQLAQSKLPKFIFDYLNGGADDEWVLHNNRAVFAEYGLLTEVLKDVSDIDTSTTILGMKTAAPFILSSTGASRFFHPEGEVAVARAAANENVLYGIAASAMSSIEEVAAVGTGPRFFQVYVFKDSGLNREFVQRSKAAGYQAMYLTVDSVVAGNRERDLRNQLSIPPKITPRTVWQVGTRPKWAIDYLTNPAWTFPNVESALDDATKSNFGSIAGWFASQFDRSFTWDDAARLIAEWDGPFVIKGITRPQDAIRAAEIGATGIVVSNHGGRQLDRLPSSIELLPGIVDVVGDRLEVFVDSGFRRGTDIITALALGAKAVAIGRPYLYGLAAGGEAGVSRVVQLLKSEIVRDMTMMGLTSIDQINRDALFERNRK